MKAIPLEDNYNDVLAKALRGLKVTREDLATRAGVAVPVVMGLLDGAFEAGAIRQVAPLLNLGPDQLVALGEGSYYPEVPAPDGLACYNTPFDDYFVNAYLVWDPATKRAVAFDTGSDSSQMLREAQERGLTIELVLLTHTHRDHIMDLESVKRATGAPAYVSPLESTPGAEPLPEGRTFQFGALKIEPRRTSGHSKGGTSYVVTGLAVPLVVVGDALFAGSMGGGIVSFEDALANNRQQILTLGEETIICPGHGPLTTVGLERRNNPFYPELRDGAR